MHMRNANGPRNVFRDRLVADSHRLASCTIVSGFRAALDLNTYPLRNLIRPRCAEQAKLGRGKASAHYAYWLFSLFSRHISRTQSFQQNRHIIFPALVALKLLISLMSRLVACSPRFRPDRHTDTQTHRQNDYCNPRCACARRGLMKHDTPSAASLSFYGIPTSFLFTCIVACHG